MTKVVTVLLWLALVPGLALTQAHASSEETPSVPVVNPLTVITDEDTSFSTPQPTQESSAGEIKGGRQHRKRPCSHCSRSRPSRFGGGGGFSGGYLFANLDRINSQIRQMGIDELSENVLVIGGKGYARLGRFIIGGGGYGMTSETSGIPDGCARYAQLEIGYGGMLLGLSQTSRRYELIGGLLLGGGSVTIERRRNSRYVFGWNDAWDIFHSGGPDSIAVQDLNVTSRLTASFIAIEPFVEIKYHLLPFMALEISASYLRARIGHGQWKLDNIKIPDSPSMDVGGPSVRVGLHFGV